MASSPNFRLADHLLEEGIAAFVGDRRAAGRSWRLITRDVYEATDHQVDVTYETLRSWFPESAPAEVAS